LLKNDGVDDGDQVFILSEILRYLESEKSGINHFDQMNSEWKDVVNKVKSNAPLAKASDDVQNTIAAWHQEQRDLCLIMSRLTVSDVSLKLKNDHRLDPAKRLKDDADAFCKAPSLQCSLNIINAAADLDVTADLQRRMIYCSMHLTAPKDKQSTKARTNWILRQLKKTDPKGFYIRATRPGKAEATYQALKDLRDSPELLDSDTSNTAATALEVVYEIDLAGKFNGRKVFVEELEKAVPHFYQEAGQLLKAWAPPPPKIATSDSEPEESCVNKQRLEAITQKRHKPLPYTPETCLFGFTHKTIDQRNRHIPKNCIRGHNAWKVVINPTATGRGPCLCSRHTGGIALVAVGLTGGLFT